MGYFPLCINLEGADVILLGDGALAREKREVLLPFGPNLRQFPYDYSLTEADLVPRPAMVVVADMPWAEKERISRLCHSKGIPVNVVDVPELCSFYFPSLVTDGSLTVAVSTAGKSPGVAAWLRRHLQKHIPTQTAQIVEWVYGFRQRLITQHPEADRRTILRQVVSQALTENRLLSEAELQTILRNCK